MHKKKKPSYFCGSRKDGAPVIVINELRGFSRYTRQSASCESLGTPVPQVEGQPAIKQTKIASVILIVNPGSTERLSRVLCVCYDLLCLVAESSRRFQTCINFFRGGVCHEHVLITRSSNECLWGLAFLVFLVCEERLAVSRVITKRGGLFAS